MFLSPESQLLPVVHHYWRLLQLNPARRIIFIAHSLGGIIVKEVFAAFREHETYPMIWAFTYAIFFLAVIPHMGSGHATWGQVLANVTRGNYPAEQLVFGKRETAFSLQ